MKRYRCWYFQHSETAKIVIAQSIHQARRMYAADLGVDVCMVLVRRA